MEERIPPTQKALEEALELSAEILRNIELSELPLANIGLKAGRLALLLNELDMQKVMQFEACGYPTTPHGVSREVKRLARMAGREYEVTDNKTGEREACVYVDSIEQLEREAKTAEADLEAARSHSVAVSYPNPIEQLFNPFGESAKLAVIRTKLLRARQRLWNRRALIHGYALRKHYELKFSGIADDIFSRIRKRVDSAIGDTIPQAVQKLSAVYESLKSENPEDWSNAVHSCRRILHDLADAVFPPQEDRTVVESGKRKTIKLGKDNYINRIIAFVQDHSNSEKFAAIVGSHLRFLGERLDSIFKATQKGSHDVIVTREEADRYVVYTYLVVGDVLSLI